MSNFHAGPEVGEDNELWLEAWLKCRIKTDKEERENIQKSKETVKSINFSWQ